MARFTFYLVHGTQFYLCKRPAIDWIRHTSAFCQGLASDLRDRGHQVAFRTIQWSGRNRHGHRLKAAQRIEGKLGAARGPDEYRFLIGHSHGGNACLLALNDETNGLAGRIDGVVCLSTPFLVLWRTSWAMPMTIACFAAWLLAGAISMFSWLEGSFLSLIMVWVLIIAMALGATAGLNLVNRIPLSRWSLPRKSPVPVLIVRCPGDEASGALGFIPLLARAVFLVENTVGRFWRTVVRHPVGSWLAGTAILSSVGIAAAFSETFQAFLNIHLETVGWVLVSVFAVPLLCGVPIRMLVYGLSYGYDLGLMTLRCSVSAEATPLGEWTTRLVPPRASEDLPGLAHSEPYAHPDVWKAVAQWVSDHTSRSVSPRFRLDSSQIAGRFPASKPSSAEPQDYWFASLPVGSLLTPHRTSVTTKGMSGAPDQQALLPYDAEKYRENYSEEQFWMKVRRFAKTAGKRVVESALQLYFAAESPETPAKAKAVIYGSLAYFISPLDFIPDLLPGVGYTDDLTVLLAAIGVVASHITPEIKRRAAQKVGEWFPA